MMKKPRKNVSLMTFLKGSSNPNLMMPGCADLCPHRPGDCFRYGRCVVMEGQPCDYFEKAVLPTAKDIGQQERMDRLYAEGTGAEAANTTKRPCPMCGVELKKHKRFCTDCAKRRQRETYRRGRRKSA